jgi:hypothetical protein
VEKPARHVEEEVVPILRVADAIVATAWYTRLGFLKESEHRFAPGLQHSSPSPDVDAIAD